MRGVGTFITNIVLRAAGTLMITVAINMYFSRSIPLPDIAIIVLLGAFLIASGTHAGKGKVEIEAVQSEKGLMLKGVHCDKSLPV
ncbi:MAG: hypothetical protein V1911_00200 [Candidatus Micrarchaeota archaeon]